MRRQRGDVEAPSPPALRRDVGILPRRRRLLVPESAVFCVVSLDMQTSAHMCPAEHSDQPRTANPDHVHDRVTWSEAWATRSSGRTIWGSEIRAMSFSPNRAMRTAARNAAGTERCAQHQTAACNREQPRSEALPRDSERQEAPLNQASHAHDFDSKSESQLLCGCAVAALARAVKISARLCSVALQTNELRNMPRCGAGL